MPPAQKPPSCQGCALFEKGTGFARLEGSGTLKILVIGEALGEMEARQSLPFRPWAQAGSMLNRILEKAQINREQLRITNIVNCRPPNNWLSGAPWEYPAIEHCKQHWQDVVRWMKPRVIVALGDVAFRTLTGFAGKKQTISSMRGYPIETPYGIVIGTYHPSFIKRGKQNLMGVCIGDFEKAREVAQKGVESRRHSYQTNPTIADAKSFASEVARNPRSLLSYDIETPYTKDKDEEEYLEESEDEEPNLEGITTVQFSLARGTGICLPFIGEFIDICRSILGGPNPKLGHNNWRFDDPNLRAAAIGVEGIVHDTFWAFRHLEPDLQGHYNVQSVGSFFGFPFPWKHLAHSQPEFYGCADVDVLHWIWPPLVAKMKAMGVWEGYERQKRQMEPLLVRLGARGIPINTERREEFGASLERQKLDISREQQILFPDELKKAQPKEGYKREPKDTTGMVLRTFDGVERWCKLKPFKTSQKQVIAYLKHKGYEVPRHKKEDRDTTDADALERLAKKHNDPLLKSIIEMRELNTAYGNFYKGWKPAKDGRVHPEWLNKPATGQWSSIHPNAQNGPAGKNGDSRKQEQSRMFRRMVEAKPGHWLAEFDWKSFHGMTMGYVARDAQYMRLAKLGMHDFLTSHMMKEPADFGWGDDHLLDYLGYIKKKYKAIRDTKAKPVIFQTQFGGTAHGILKKYPDYFKNKAEVQKILDLMDDLFPKVKQFKQHIKKLGEIAYYRREPFTLVSPFGYCRHFWHPVEKTDDGYKTAEDYEDALAFLPANIAFGHKKEVILALPEPIEQMWIMDMHDMLMFEVPDRLLDSTIGMIKDRMEAPSKILIDPEVAPEGLAVEVDCKVGRNWSMMIDYKSKEERRAA